MQLRDIRSLTALLTTLIVIDAAPRLFFVLWISVSREGFIAAIGPVAAPGYVAMLAFRAVTMIVFLRWVYVAGDNLIRAGFDNVSRPIARIVAFLIPVINFYMPFPAMRELWNASHNLTDHRRSAPLVTYWWLFWVGGGFVGYTFEFTSFRSGALGVLWLLTAIKLIQAAIAIMMIREIARAQRNLPGADLEEVFA